MRPRLQLLLALAIYWMAFMTCCRGLFMAYHFTLTRTLTTSEMARTLLYGARMDASLSGYLLMFAGLVLTISVLKTYAGLRWALHGLNIGFALISCMIVVVDLELYRHWGFRMNTTPLFYLSEEALASAQQTVVLALAVIFVVMAGASVFVYVRYFFPRLLLLEPGRLRIIPPLLLITGLLFIPIRSSFTVAPMNTGMVYYSRTKPFANHAGINVVWNFFYSLSEQGRTRYPEDLLDKDKTEHLFSEIMATPLSGPQLLNETRPNILLIILESFTADIIEPLGGMKDVAPNLNALCQEGILFSQTYATGDRTDKGLLGILSGYPALPLTSTTKYPGKTQSLPFLSEHLEKLGYHTSFDYGGDADFANIHSFLVTGGFRNMTSLDDFPGEQNTAKWGVRDEFLFSRIQQELDTASMPFFKVALTLSSHEPFDVPQRSGMETKSEEALFLNACRYTDECLGAFILWCKKQPWWDQTLIILVADHGHRHPGNKPLRAKERFHIPLLWIGGAVRIDTVIATIGSQTDIANTLLAQIDSCSPDFPFSRNLAAYGAPSFALYFFNNGYGYLDSARYAVFDM